MTSIVGEAESVAVGAVTTAGSPILLWALAALGAVAVSLLTTIGFYHYVTVPRMQAKVDTATAKEAVAEAQAGVCKADNDTLKSSIDSQNQTILTLQTKAKADSDAAAARAKASLAKPQKLPDHHAADVNAFLAGVLK